MRLWCFKKQGVFNPYQGQKIPIIHRKDRVMVLRSFIKSVGDLGYGFDELLTIILENEPLRRDVSHILLALSLEEFDDVIDYSQHIFKHHAVEVEKVRSSFMTYQLAQTCQDISYVPFHGDSSQPENQAHYMENIVNGALATHFPLKKSGERQC